MLTRIIGGFIGAVILIGMLLLPSYGLLLTALFACIVGFFEYTKAMKEKHVNVDLPIGVLASIVIIVYSYGSTLKTQVPPVVKELIDTLCTQQSIKLIAFVLILYMFFRFVFDNKGYSLQDIAYTLLGIAYIPFFLSFAVETRNMERGFEYIWIILIGSMMTDMFAYFVGVSIGKNKIIPHISPKKTVEGSLGGAVGCMISMIIYGAFIINRSGAIPMPLYHFAIMGLLCGVVSQVGDWFASAIKRDTGIKDFGNLIPGHGGIMDRVDSILFVSPVVYFYISLFMS